MGQIKINVWNGFYACTKEVGGTGARCRGNILTCPAHSRNPEKRKNAPMPDHLKFKVELTDEWRDIFKNVEVESRTWSERRMRAARHVEQAEKLGRSTDAFVGQIEKSGEPLPENYHSGSPIFGDKGGLDLVDVTNVETQIRAAGFKLVKASVLVRSGKGRKPPILVLDFNRAEDVEECEFKLWDKFREMLSIPATYAHAWANPREDSGDVVHTLNCVMIDRAQHFPAHHRLEFDPASDGYWIARDVDGNIVGPPPQIATAV